jgi:hypothetical protein
LADPAADSAFHRFQRLSAAAGLSIILKTLDGSRGIVYPWIRYSAAEHDGCAFRQRVLEN